MPGDGSIPQAILIGEQIEMNRRYAILGLSVFLALALAVPALGGPSNPVASLSATAKSIANKALKKAKTAQKTANSANSTANSANSTANAALTEAKKGVTNAATAQAAANSAKGTADSAKAAADAAKAAAEAAEANANTRLQSAHQVFGEATATDTTTEKNASAICPAGEDTLGGGFFVGGGGNNSVTVTNSEHLFYSNGWFVAAEAITGTPTWSLAAIVMCGAT